MKIVDNGKIGKTKLKDVSKGTVFEYKGEYYIKTNEEREVDDYGNVVSYYVTNLSSGDSESVNALEPIQICEAELHINGRGHEE